MNEGAAIYLNIDPSEEEANEELIRRIDRLLLDYGVEYTGIGNIYRASDPADRDRMIYAARRALRSADWMEGKLTGFMIMNQTNVCRTEEILLDYMEPPRPEKLAYYEEYYRSSGRLAHGIVVDENRQLRDGYTSCLLSRKYGIQPDICEALSDQPVKKVVAGRHVVRDGDAWKIKTKKRYSWLYAPEAPVVPGDILEVSAKQEPAFMRVDSIIYATGKDFCEEHRPVIRHMNSRMEEAPLSKMS